MKTSENIVKYSSFNMGEMDKSWELYSKVGGNSSRFEGKAVPWEHTITIYRPFLKHCTLTNKAVGAMWRTLSKPPQRRWGTVPHPYDCSSGLMQPFNRSSRTDSAYHLIFFFLQKKCVCYIFNYLSAWVSYWSSVGIRRIINWFSDACPFEYIAVAVCRQARIR